MNVNDILNYCRTAERGCAEKETTMAVEGTWKGGVNFHRELNTVFGLHWPGEPKVARWP
jgi:hypothetical protein